MNKRAFSFVEIIISISILVVLAIVATTATNNIKNNSNNSKVIADLATLQNWFISMSNEWNKLPEPNWNKNYYTQSGSYAHDKSEAYWVYWKVTQDTLDNRYLNITPLDPRTNQYYSYWVAIDSNQFEVAWVLFNEEWHRAKVQWNYSAENGIYNLIRDHNSNNFVIDKGPYLPYNPEEKLLTARDSEGNVYYEWDEITNNSWWQLELYFSDGSTSVIDNGTSLVLAQMDFPKENNLVSKVKIFLDAGSIWTQATSLDDESSFDIFTTDTTASVRWTIFGVDTNGTDTQVTVEKWKVEVKKIPLNISKEQITREPAVISKQIEDTIYNDQIAPEILDTSSSSMDWKVIKFDWNTIQEIDISTIERPVVEKMVSAMNFEQTNIVTTDNTETIDTTVEEIWQSCYLWEVEISDQSEIQAFSQRESINCSDYTETRFCNDWILEWNNSYKYPNCSKPDTCPLSYNRNVEHVETWIIYDFTVWLGTLNIQEWEITTWITSQWKDIENWVKKLVMNLKCDSDLNYLPVQQTEQVFCDEGYTPWTLPWEKTMSCISDCSWVTLWWECVENNISGDDEDWSVYAHIPYNDDSSSQNNLYKLSNKNWWNVYPNYNTNALDHWSRANYSLIDNSWTKWQYNFYSKSANKSIYIDNIGNQSCFLGICSSNPWWQDYLKYSWILNDDQYAIEISVRWKELKRNDSTDRYLFETWPNWVGLYQQNWKLYVLDKTDQSMEFSNEIDIFSKITRSNLDDDKFYKILLYVDENDFRLHILNQNWDIIWQIFDNTTASEPHGYNLSKDNNLQHIYIWSNNNRNNQWNWLIDYVTIYEQD